MEHSDGTEHIGIDEAGRGCLAGPVVAAAVLFHSDEDFAGPLAGLADSKTLTAKKRELLAAQVLQHAVAYGVGISWQQEVDSVNVLNATFRAMSRAVFTLAAGWGGAALPKLRIDGDKCIPAPQWRLSAEPAPGFPPGLEKGVNLPVNLFPSPLPALPEQEAIVDGDALVPSISAASILAKTLRDSLMEQLDALYPGYGLAQHKGYGTKAHLAAIQEKGACPLHRKSFRGVREEARQLTLPF